MLKIILDYLKSWFAYKPDFYELNKIYKNCLYVTHNANTLVGLLHAKKFIKAHAQLTNQYNMSILHKRQQDLEKLWEFKYKLWKSKGY